MRRMVSLLIPIYNVHNYIERCARSLFEQTYDNIEFVFINDCSPDNSIGILGRVMEEYPHLHKQIKIINHERNRGLAASRLTGIDNASGDYLMFVDSDDYLELNAVKMLMEEAMESDYEIVTGGIRHIFENKCFVSLPPIGVSRDSFLRLILKGSISHNTVSRVYKKELFTKNKRLFVEGINSGEDYLMVSRVFYDAKRVSFVNAPLYNYIHTNPTSFTARFIRNNYDQQIEAERLVREFYEEKGETVFIDAQIEGCLKNKAQSIILLLLNDYNLSDYKYVAGMYSSDEQIYLHKIPLQYRMVLQLSKRIGDKDLSRIVRLGYGLKGFYKRIVS